MGWGKQFQFKPNLALCRQTAVDALQQDAKKDSTSEKCISSSAFCTATIVAKSSLTLCGVIEATAIFASKNIVAKWHFSEGKKIRPGQKICTLTGNCRSILACERTALNFLMLLSGIATKSHAASEKFGKWKLAATRKTLPLLNECSKRAVMVGGCLSHRRDLSSGILVKDNHIEAIMKMKKIRKPEAIRQAVQSFPTSSFVEVEVSSASEAVSAAKAGAKAILVDNTLPAKFSLITKAVRRTNPNLIIEASGGITLKNAGSYLKAGANFASTSELTMRIEPTNLSLEIQ